MLGDRLGLTGWLAAAALVVVTFLVGFVWLPALQENARAGWWDAICRAVGISPPAEFVRATPGPAQSSTDVVWNPETLRLARSGDAQRGSALAAVCAGCHGAKGISPTDAFPNLAGLPAEVLYKQLDDYRGGKRKSPIMQPLTANLTDQNIADLAAHFAAFPVPTVPSRGDAAAPVLVTVGSPLRSIAPCAACHGPLGHKLGAPPLTGQKRAYLEKELDAFATGARANDINQQMREVARALTASERAALAGWYGEPSPAAATAGQSRQ